MPNDPRDTPAMQQYFRFKKRHPDCVLLFRIGDFYELFDDDAVKVSKAIGLTLTQRTAGIPMCGVPYHQLEAYLKKLIAQGFRVAVCEQLQGAGQAKGIVPRAVTRVLTPGTLVDESLLEGEAPTTLAAIVFTGEGEESPASLAVVEVSTGAFMLVDSGAPAIVDELMRRGVRELLFAPTADGKASPRVSRVLDALGLAGTPRPAWQFRPSEAAEALTAHFGVATLAGFGLSDTDGALPAAGAVIRYLQETQTLSEEDAKTAAGLIPVRACLKHLRPPRREDAQAHCVVDAVSLRSLEVERTIRGSVGNLSAAGALEGSLLGVFLAAATGPRSLCRTAMGKRLLRDWLCRPLRNINAIGARQEAVATLVEDRKLAEQVGEVLGAVQDVARIAGRVALARASPRDLVGLARSLDKAEAILEAIEGVASLAGIAGRIEASRAQVTPVASAILAACVEEPPPHLREGGCIRDGFDARLDEARLLQKDAGSWLSEYQGTLSAKFKLPGLKVGYNRVFGYYIELPQAQARSAPAELLRKQTLKNAERYTTPELREFEGKVTTAEARALDREREIFAQLCVQATGVLGEIAAFADAVAELDVLLAFADKAARRGWTRPRIVESPVLQIHAGRHPVLDESLGGDFVPNDVELGDRAKFEHPGAEAARASGPVSLDTRDRPENREQPVEDTGREARGMLALITGPNMAGKSTYIRQAALLALLAHTGSFIPADRATIGIIDRIFTRIGADDALHAGQSTFMVEMIETANILNHATGQSLVILDEVGRGTSTLDGLSLAWAIVEYLAAPSRSESSHPASPRTLFATHYHELTELEERLPGRIANLHVAVREWPSGDEHAQIVFLHRILPGATDQSYGLHVARLAGIPAAVITRGREVLASLAVHHAGSAKPAATVPAPKPDEDGQLSLFTQYLSHPAVDALREVKLDSMSPMQAFDALRKLKSLTEQP
jgi:DNA mismatch repair protein MutS